MAKFMFTFVFNDRAKNFNTDEDDYYQVTATTYPAAVKKILKLKLPGVESEDDLKFKSVLEESSMEIINNSGDDEQEVEG